MERSRADKILADWDEISRAAVRPGVPTRTTLTTALPGSMLAGVAVLVIAIAAAGVWLGLSRGTGTTEPSASPTEPSPTETHGPTASPSASPIEDFDLAGTAWRVTTLDDQALPAEGAPWFEFDSFGRPGGHGFSGCDEFGFGGTFEGGTGSAGELILNPAGCSGPAAPLEKLFLDTFRAVDAWSVEGDLLTLFGSGGQIVLTRELPPVGDPGRALADTLLTAEWQILEATGVAGLDRLSPMQFFDRRLLGVGECGYSGDVHFGSGGSLTISDVGWDTSGCGEPDGRVALQSALQSVSAGSLEDGGTVRLSGPGMDLVLGRVWGPLAVVPPQDGADTARSEGTLRITDACVVLEEADSVMLLVWPADRTRWDPQSQSITFTNFDGTIVTASDGDAVALGGGGDSVAEGGITGEEWVRRREWVAPPATACPLDERWDVGAVLQDGSASSGSSGVDVVREFLDARLAGDYATAWELLATNARPGGGEEQWAKDEARAIPTLGPYELEQVSQTDLNPAAIDVEAAVRAIAEWDNAVFVVVRFPEEESASLGEMEFIAAPLKETSTWRVWPVR
jgi:heat shock protein HslJ